MWLQVPRFNIRGWKCGLESSHCLTAVPGDAAGCQGMFISDVCHASAAATGSDLQSVSLWENLTVMLNSAFSPRNRNAPETHLTTMAKRTCIDSASTLLTKICKTIFKTGQLAIYTQVMINSWFLKCHYDGKRRGHSRRAKETIRSLSVLLLCFRRTGIFWSAYCSLCQGQSRQLLPQQNTPHSSSSFMLLPHTSISQINFSGKLPYQILPCVGGPGE